MEERKEIERLRDINAMLLKQLIEKIECSYFCALPECAQQLRNSNDKYCKNSQTAG